MVLRHFQDILATILKTFENSSILTTPTINFKLFEIHQQVARNIGEHGQFTRLFGEYFKNNLQLF